MGSAGTLVQSTMWFGTCPHIKLFPQTLWMDQEQSILMGIRARVDESDRLEKEAAALEDFGAQETSEAGAVNYRLGSRHTLRTVRTRTQD